MTAPTASDKSQIGLSTSAAADLDYLQEELKLVNRLDAYRLAVAVALRKELVPSEAALSRTTAYSATGTLDPDGQIRAAVLALRTDHDGRPYALVERLAEAGLRDIRTHVESGLPLREYLQAVGVAESATSTQAPEPDSPPA